MPFALNLIYAVALVIFSPLALLPMAASGQVPRGLGREAAGQGTVADRRTALPLVSRRERGRGAAAPPAGAGDGPSPAQLGGGDLDLDLNGPGGGPPDVYPDLVTFYAPLDFSWSTRRAIGADPADGAGAGGARALAEPDPRGQAVGGQGRDHQRPAQHPELSRLSQPAAAVAADLGPHRRGGCSECGICPAVRRAGDSESSGQRDRLGQVRRARERSEQCPDS